MLASFITAVTKAFRTAEICPSSGTSFDNFLRKSDIKIMIGSMRRSSASIIRKKHLKKFSFYMRIWPEKYWPFKACPHEDACQFVYRWN